MVEDYSRDLLRSGIIELKAGNRETARRYIDRALYMSGDHEVLAEGWYWMSQLAETPAEQREALENCLAHDLRHARARRALAVLDGKLKPEEIIDPDERGAAGMASADERRLADGERFMCPKCGARMHFAPDGQSLVCDYCTRGAPLQAGSPERRATTENDFLIAMATARGHDRPLAEQVFVCHGCGARFILPPAQLSITCPYCGSPHVLSFEKSPDLLAPDGIIPHAFDQVRAAAIIKEWARSKLRRITGPETHIEPHGLYLPVWTFDIAGSIEYTGELVEHESEEYGARYPVRREHVSGSYPVALSWVPVPASRKLSGPFIRLLPGYQLKAAEPYDPRYLADWPAELYDIPMAEASLDARSQGLAIVKRDMTARLAPVTDIRASSHNIMVDSFRLILAPVWMAEIATTAGVRLVLVNGQSGDVYGQPASGAEHSGSILAWLSDLVGE